MDDAASLTQTRRLIVRCLRVMHAMLSAAETQSEMPDEARQRYERYFGKDAPVASLTRLVSLHKAVVEMQAEDARQKSQQQAMTPQALTNNEWEMVEQAVQRWRARQEQDQQQNEA